MITKRQLTKGIPTSFLRNARAYERYLWFTFKDSLPAGLACSIADHPTQAHVNYAMLQVKRSLMGAPKNMDFSYLRDVYTYPLYYTVRTYLGEAIEVDPTTDYNTVPPLREKNAQALGEALQEGWPRIMDTLGFNPEVRIPETFGRTWFEVSLNLWLGHCELPIEGLSRNDLAEKLHDISKSRERFLAWNCAYGPFLATEISPRSKSLREKYEKEVNRYFMSLYFLASFIFYHRDLLEESGKPLEAIIKNEAQLFRILTATPWQLASFSLARITDFVKKHSQ